MILFQNVYITDTHAKGVAAFQDRQMAKTFDKLDIYKYCLASISKISVGGLGTSGNKLAPTSAATS